MFLFGALPAIRAGRVDIQIALRHARFGISGGYRLLRRGLVVAEIALSLVLLSSAALLLETLWHLERDRLGFAPQHLLSVTIPMRGSGITNANRNAVADEILSFIRRIPGTEGAAASQCTPLTGGPEWLTFSRSDRPLPEPFHRGDGIHICGTGPDYFHVAGLRILRGRAMTERDFDHLGTVALINEAAAHAYFPGDDPIGKQIEGGPQGRWKTVVGVVSDSKNVGLNQAAGPAMFVNDPAMDGWPELMFLVRTLGDGDAVASAIRGKLHSVAPAAYARLETMDQAISQMDAGPRFNGILLASFAAISLLMAVVGVYGVLAFSVSQRTQEIGVRMALGAGPLRVLGLVMRESAVPVAIGTLAGIAGALLLTRYLKSLLYGVSSNDPATFAAVAASLWAAALFATCVPARRAASVDPMTALRHE